MTRTVVVKVPKIWTLRQIETFCQNRYGGTWQCCPGGSDVWICPDDVGYFEYRLREVGP